MTPPATHLPFAWQALRGQRGLGRFLAVILAVTAGLLLGSRPFVALLRSSEVVRQRGLGGAVPAPDALGLRAWMFYGLQLLPFAVCLLALGVAVRWLHRRPVRSLVTGRARALRWRRIGAAALAWSLLMVAVDLAEAYALGRAYAIAFEPATFWPVAAVLLALIPLQIAFEELAIRGYLLQAATAASGRAWLGVAVSAVVFAGLHLGNPEVRAFGLPVMLAYYSAVALFLGGLAVLDDGLELPLGIHLATNLYSTLVVNFSSSALPTPSLFVKETVDAPLMLFAFLAQAIAFLAAFAKTRRANLAAFAEVPRGSATPLAPRDPLTP